MENWKSIKKDGKPPIGKPLIVSVRNMGYGARRELRYPVVYKEDDYAIGHYGFYMNGSDILLPDYSLVTAWIPFPNPYEDDGM